MLATSFSNLSWRPVLAVLFGAFLYVICLPMATQVRHTTRPFFVLFFIHPYFSLFLKNIQSRGLYIDVFEKFTGCVIPLSGVLLVLVATVSSGN
jgi:hypothetical protein